MTTIDPIRLEVIRNALVAASEEMNISIWRTARSTVVRETLDYSTAIFDGRSPDPAHALFSSIETPENFGLTRSRTHRTLRRAARVAELVDALDSESSVRKDVLVRLQSRAPLTPRLAGPSRSAHSRPATRNPRRTTLVATISPALRREGYRPGHA